MSKLIEKLKKEFDVDKVYKWHGYVNDSREKNVVKIVENAAKFTSLTPSYLCTIAVGEGLGLWIEDSYAASSPHNVRVNDSIDGFDYLGVDHFAADFNRTKKYLPKDYNLGDEYNTVSRINEHGNTVQSASFKNLQAGLQALAATIALRKQLFLTHSKELGYIKDYGNPTKEQEAFWTYVYFQGEGRAKAYLKDNKGYNYLKAPPGLMNQIRTLALERVAAWKFLQSKKIFTS
jgi:hypothetical protein